jgi:hypothetical protein
MDTDSVPGFPNFFTVFGPYGYVGSSYFALIEAQTHVPLRPTTTLEAFWRSRRFDFDDYRFSA